jgi:hypothetical protein
MSKWTYDDEYGGGDEVFIECPDWLEPPERISMLHPASGDLIDFARVEADS